MEAPVFQSFEEKVDPRHTAVVVVDMQNDYIADGGFFDQIGRNRKDMQEMTPRLMDFVEKARAHGVSVVWFRNNYADIYLNANHREYTLRKGFSKTPAQPGTFGQEFYLVKPREDETIVTKHRFDGFEGTSLDLILKSKGIHTLVMTGVTTECCVESTSRRGFFMGYYIVLVEDCCGTYDPAFHQNTLRLIDTYFGEVADAEKVGAAWAMVADERAAGKAAGKEGT